jgi:hypothetical protein
MSITYKNTVTRKVGEYYQNSKKLVNPHTSSTD